MGSLGDGLRALRALASMGPAVLSERATLRDKLCDELTCEAYKFVVYRVSKMRGRELISLDRLRSLTTMIKHAA
jgi:hypothetical protein